MTNKAKSQSKTETMPCQYDGCTAQIVIRPNGKYCDDCKAKLRVISDRKNRERQEHKRQEQKSARLAGTTTERVFKQASDADTLHWMRYLIHQVSDVGESGPVKVYFHCEVKTAELFRLYA